MKITRPWYNLAMAGGRPTVFTEDSAIIFSDLVGKLLALQIACDKCGRKRR